MNWKQRISIMCAALAMVTPKLLDEIADLLDDDPSTVFSWRFILSLLSGPLIAFLIGEQVGLNNRRAAAND